MAMSPTGSGKTVITGRIIKDANLPTTSIAHRAELVLQISLQQAREGIRHRIIGPEKLQSRVSKEHLRKLGADYVNRHSRFAVAGVDTLIRLAPEDPIFKTTEFWMIDEGHHVLKANKWGRAVGMFRKGIYGLLPTATPGRADGKGLGAHADGVADDLIMGPSPRELINRGFLCDYRVICSKSTLDRAKMHVTASGELEQKEMARQTKASSVTGDVVRTYQTHAMGKKTIVFAADLEHAGMIAKGLRGIGVRAEVISGDTDPDLRNSLLDRFESGALDCLVNVDLFGEGFDLPALECVIMARPTESFPLFAQMFGRALRLAISSVLAAAWDTYADFQRLQFIAQSSKPKALIIDHVGNIERHGLPDKPRVWSLDARDRRGNSENDMIPMRVCQVCAGAYERIFKICPYCKHVHVPAGRSSIAHVDGDMFELPPELLAAMRGEIAKIDSAPLIASGLPELAQRAQANRHMEKQQAQAVLREQITMWAALQRHRGHADDEIRKLFYFTFGIDIYSAMALARADAEKLTERIMKKLEIDGVVRSDYAAA